MAIGELSVEFHLQPTVAVAARETFPKVEILGSALLRVRGAVERHIAYVVGIAHVGERVDVPDTG